MVALTINWKIFIVWTVLRTMKLPRSLLFYTIRLNFIDLLIFTVVVLFLVRFT